MKLIIRMKFKFKIITKKCTDFKIISIKNL